MMHHGVEINRMINVMKRNFAIFSGRALTPATPFALKQVVFRSCTYGAGIGAFEAFVLRPQNSEVLDTWCLALANRATPERYRCQYGEQGWRKRLSHDEFVKLRVLVPIELYLEVAWVRGLQSLWARRVVWVCERVRDERHPR